MLYLYRIFFVLLLLFTCMVTKAGNVTVIDKEVLLAPHFQYFYAGGEHTSFEEVRKLPDRNFSGKVPKGYFGLNNNEFWAKVHLVFSEKGPNKWVVFDNLLTFDYIDLYVVHAGNVTHMQNGLLNKDKNSFPSRKLVFELTKPDKLSKVTLFFKFKTEMPLLVDYRIAPYYAFISHETEVTLIHAVYFGFMWVFFFYALAISRLNRLYLWVAGFILSATLWNGVTGGQSILLFEETWSLSDVLPFLELSKPGNSLALVAFIYFSYFSIFVSKYLDLEKHAPGLHKIIRSLFLFGLACGVTAMFYRDTVVVVFLLLYHTSVIFLAFYGSWVVTKKTSLDKAAVIAPFSMMLLSFLFFNLANIGYIESAVASRFGNFIAPLFVVIFLMRGVNKIHSNYESVYQHSMQIKEDSQLLKDLQIKVIDTFKSFVVPRFNTIASLTAYQASGTSNPYLGSRILAEIEPVQETTLVFRDVSSSLSKLELNTIRADEFEKLLVKSLADSGVSLEGEINTELRANDEVIKAGLTLLSIKAFLKPLNLSDASSKAFYKIVRQESKLASLDIILECGGDEHTYEVATCLERISYQQSLDQFETSFAIQEYNLISSVLPLKSWDVYVENDLSNYQFTMSIKIPLIITES